MYKYTQTLASKDDIDTVTYYKNSRGVFALQNVYVSSIDGDTVVARRGATGPFKNHTKEQLFRYINLGRFSYEAP